MKSNLFCAAVFLFISFSVFSFFSATVFAGQLVYSTYLGGGNDDVGYGIAIDGSGNAYITGYTYSSTDFPTTPGAFDTLSNGSSDVFVSKLNARAR